MKNPILQGLITVLLFFGTWYALKQFDWMKIFKVQQATEKTEQKLGELFWEVFKKSKDEIIDSSVVNSLDSIVNRICNANKIDRGKLKIHVLNNDDINAFALPNGHLIINSGLLLNSDNPEQLTGVVCHEIAHIELNHVMKKLVKEIGLSVLISATTGNGGGKVINEAAKMLSSSAFDRNLEKDADIKAVDYLVKANVNPEPFADFLYTLSEGENSATKYLTWINTHPDSKERAAYIIEYSKGKLTEYKPILSSAAWENLKAALTE